MATPYAAIYYELDKMTPHCVRKQRILRYWMKLLSSNTVFWIPVMLMCIIKLWAKTNVKTGLQRFRTCYQVLY